MSVPPPRMDPDRAGQQPEPALRQGPAPPPSCLAAVAGDFDRAPEAIDDWMIAVWLSAWEEGFHDTTVAEPLAALASVAH